MKKATLNWLQSSAYDVKTAETLLKNHQTDKRADEMVKKKHTATEIRKIVKAMVALLTENNVPVEKMILYGSYANGMPRAYSDIDVAVISPAFRGKKLIETQAELAKILAKYLAMVEPVGYSPDAFRTAELETLLGEIKRTGKVLFAA